MSIRAIRLAVLIISAAAGGAIAAQSAYTTLDFTHGCKPVGGPPTQEDTDLGVLALLCKGYKDYPVQYNQGDERTTVHFGDPARATSQHGWETFEAFNSTADTIEWRLDDKGVPYAAIQRALVSIGEQNGPTPDKASQGQILVISQVGQPGSASGCVVGLVDALANADANQLARQIADETAPQFRCGQDKPAYHGKRGRKTSDFDAYFGE
jgi:hypothetical protein